MHTPFVEKLKAVIAEKHLLKHPFYQHWSAGTLPVEVMREYAKQYYHLENTFPRLLSRVHTYCVDPKIRQILSDNLHDEEYGEKNHRELWLRFAESIGVSRQDVVASEPLPETQGAITSLMDACDAGTLSGIGALSAYESQIPSVAESKIAGLKEHYGITDERGTEFFSLHGVVDVEHSDAWWNVIAAHAESADAQAQTKQGTITGRDALWGFLDGVCRAYFPQALASC